MIRLNVLTGYVDSVSVDNPNRDFILEIIDEINGENVRLDREFQDIAEAISEAMYEAIPTEIRTPYNRKAATEYKKSQYQSTLAELRRGCLYINVSTIREIVVSAWKNVEVNGKLYVVKSVFSGEKNIQDTILKLAEKKAARAMGIG